MSGQTLSDTPPPSATLPEGCQAYTGKYAENGGFRCEIRRDLISGAGKDWGPWIRLTSVAPKGYVLRYSEGNVQAEYHKCGVRDEGATSPPYNGDHHRAGEAFYAQCIIMERDNSHVTIEFSIQGKEAPNGWGFGDRDTANGNKYPARTLAGKAVITAIYVPATGR